MCDFLADISEHNSPDLSPDVSEQNRSDRWSLLFGPKNARGIEALSGMLSLSLDVGWDSFEAVISCHPHAKGREVQLCDGVGKLYGVHQERQRQKQFKHFLR